MTEKVSAAVDAAPGEKHERVLEQVSKDAGLRRKWERYHLIGALMRREAGVNVCAGGGLAERIAAAVDAEPTCLAPEAAARGRRLPVFNRDFFKTAAGLAAAAALGAVAVLGLQPAQDPEPQLLAEHVTRWQTDQPEHEADLNALLVEHGEFTPPSGMNGLMAYARFVSYDTGR